MTDRVEDTHFGAPPYMIAFPPTELLIRLSLRVVDQHA
jgi:hypothetical protein